MPQSKEVHKEYMRRLRGSKKGSQNSKVHSEGSQYPALLLALVNPVKREKLEAISGALKARHLSGEVYYGYGGPDFDMVSELLEVTA